MITLFAHKGLTASHFRAAYGKIGNVRAFTTVPLLCLTATASKKDKTEDHPVSSHEKCDGS